MISLSISRILESVYAHSAAEIVSTGVERPEILGRSHEEMLKVITRDTIAALAYAMMPIVTDSNIAEKPIPEVITLEIKVPDTVSRGCYALQSKLPLRRASSPGHGVGVKALCTGDIARLSK